MSGNTEVIVIGGGFAGVVAADRLTKGPRRRQLVVR